MTTNSRIGIQRILEAILIALISAAGSAYITTAKLEVVTADIREQVTEVKSVIREVQRDYAQKDDLIRVESKIDNHIERSTRK